MLVLGIETTGAKGSCAVLETEGREILASREITGQMSHLKELARDINDMLDELGKTPGDIGAVAVSAGPGSFTGIRIGVTTARTLGQALDVPCVAVNTLELFRGLPGDGRGCAVILNARRGQVYGAVFDGEGKDILPPGPYMLTDVLDAAEEYAGSGAERSRGIRFYGDGIDAYRKMPEYEERLSAFEMAGTDERYQNARLVCLKAADMLDSGAAVSWSDIEPEYMRLAEAEQKLRDGSLRRMQEKKWRNLL